MSITPSRVSIAHPAATPPPPGAPRPDRPMPGTLRHQHGTRHRRLDILGTAQVSFGHHLRLAVHTSHLAQVPVGLPIDLLRVQTRHTTTLGHTPKRTSPGPSTMTYRRSAGIRQQPLAFKINLSRTLRLAGW